MPEPGRPGAEARNILPQELTDRRRPGRVEYNNQHVIAMMRDPTALDPATLADVSVPFDNSGDESDESDNLAPARGILTGLLLALPFWALIGAGAWFFLRG